MNNYFTYSANGTVLNSDMWETYAYDLDRVKIEQNNSIQIHVRDWLFLNDKSASVMAVKKAETGVFSFSVFSMLPSHSLMDSRPGYNTIRFGLKVDDGNRIEFYHRLTGNYNLAFRVVKSGLTIYEVADVAKEFVHTKIVVGHSLISAYLWSNDEWTPIGEFSTSIGGGKSIFMEGDKIAMTKCSMRDISVSYQDFYSATYTPRPPLNATDVRENGAVANGVTDCASAINLTLQDGDAIIEDGRFIINSSILIPSNRTLYVRNAVIRMGDATYDNLFRNADMDNGNNGIRIIGLGNVVFDKNMENNFPDAVSDKYQHPVGILCNVNDFQVSGIDSVNKPFYFMFLQNASNGKVFDLSFTYYKWGVDGVQYSDRDGVQIGWNSHDIELYNFRGFTGDDFVSIYVGGTDDPAAPYYNTGAGFNIGDAYNIYWHDFNIYSCGHSLNLIIGDGNEIHDIVYRNVYIRGSGRGYIELGYPNNANVSPIKDEFYNILVDQVRQVTAYTPYFKFKENMKNVVISNFTKDVEATDYTIEAGKTLENVTFNGKDISTV